MVLPAMAIAGATVAANALAQAYIANKQMGAERDRLNEIRREFDAIKPPDIDTDIETWAIQNKDSLPQFGDIPSFEFMTPEQYKVVEKYNPQYAQYIQQQSPELVKRSAVGEEGLKAQRDVLRKIMTTGTLDRDPELEQRFAEADRNAQIGAQSRQQSMMQDFARRGQAGSGLQLAAQLGAGESAMDRSAQQSQQAAAESYRNRLQQLIQGGQLGGQMEQRDLSTQEKNADIINRFNEMTSKNYQNYLNNRADLANKAQLYNIGQAQDTADKNVNLANINKEKMADIAKWGYEANKANKQQAFANKLSGMGSENEAKMNAYNAATSKAKSLAGLPSYPDKWGYMSPILQKGADTATQWAASSYADDRANAKEDRADARTIYEKTGRWPKDEDYE